VAQIPSGVPKVDFVENLQILECIRAAGLPFYIGRRPNPSVSRGSLVSSPRASSRMLQWRVRPNGGLGSGAALRTGLAAGNRCRESKVVQYGVQFHPPPGRERRRKARAGLSSRGLKAHTRRTWQRNSGIGLIRQTALVVRTNHLSPRRASGPKCRGRYAPILSDASVLKTIDCHDRSFIRAGSSGRGIRSAQPPGSPTGMEPAGVLAFFR
jgi:hypothetical protein